MIEIIVVTHGKFAEGLEDSINMIVGDYDNLSTIAFNPGESIESLESDITKTLQEDNIEKALIFVDVFAASPFNASMKSYNSLKDNKEIRVISGVNLPMVMGALLASDSYDLDGLANTIIDEGRDSIQDAVAQINSQIDNDDDDY